MILSAFGESKKLNTIEKARLAATIAEQKALVQKWRHPRSEKIIACLVEKSLLRTQDQKYFIDFLLYEPSKIVQHRCYSLT